MKYSIQNIINLSIYLRSVENQKLSCLSKILKSTKSSSSKAWHFPPLLRHAETKPIIWAWSWMFVFYKTDVCQASFPFILAKKKFLSPSLIFALFDWKNNFVATGFCWKKEFHLLLKMIITFMLKLTQSIRIKYSCFVMKKSKFNRLHPFWFRKNILEKHGIEQYEASFELNKLLEVFCIVFKHLTNRLRYAVSNW